MAVGAEKHQSLSQLGDEQNARVHDYLDDKLQTDGDIDNIDALLRNVLEQQQLLQEQLAEAQIVLGNASSAADTHATDVRKQAKEFNSLQETIDRRLLILTQSETSDDAIQKFDVTMAKLRQLDIAKAYVDLLNEVDQLSSEVKRNFSESPREALKPYVRLQELAYALKAAQPGAEDAAPHLVDHVELVTATLWQQMKAAFSADFEKTLKKTKWPNKDLILTGQLQTEWENGVVRLLELQDPELRANEPQKDSTGQSVRPLVLLPLEVMVQDLELRFRYHFEGDKPTNRTDKPEYFLTHVVNLINSYDGFFAEYLQPILGSYFHGSSLDLNSTCADSTSALITALLPMLRHKIAKLLPAISKQPQLLSHFMHELMSFDTSLRDDWGYNANNSVDGWKGLTWEVLVEQDWFSRWLQVEKDFALARYEAIVEPAESRELDYDSIDSNATKPTKAAIRVNDLLETITDRYRPLRSFAQKMRFLIDIQITIFDEFHEALVASLDAYIALSSSIARTVQGVSKEEHAKVEGVNGLERLCRIYGSSEYLEKKMRDWSDDVFFLELWDELQYRARRKEQDLEEGGLDLSISHLAEKTSRNVGTKDDTGALFDETAASYRRLRVRTEEVMKDSLVYDIKESLRAYGRITSWASISSDVANPASLSISSEMDAPVQLLSSYMSFLARAIAEGSLRRIARHVALEIQTLLWDNVVSRQHFSTTGVSQLSRDVAAIWAVFDRYAGKDQGRLGMRKLSDALSLIAMPIRASSSEPAGTQDISSPLSLWQVEKRVFESNESAREVLEELGLENLTEMDARTILRNRVELAS